MSKMVRRLWTSMIMILLLTMVISPLSAFADGQASETSAESEDQNIFGAVGGFFADGYNRASEGMDSIVSSASDFFGGAGEDEASLAQRQSPPHRQLNRQQRLRLLQR